ncbi:MAG: FHA domain-containing protein [Anaerolineae bacterium]|nr:FHA domain-containing protein [Anaerolineae bacterium]
MTNLRHNLGAVTLVIALSILAMPAASAQAQEAGPPANLVLDYIEATAARVDGNNQLFAYVTLIDAEGYPVSNAPVQSARITLDEGQAVPARAGWDIAEIATMVVLDASGSMVGERADAARTALIDFVSAKPPGDSVGVMFFHDTVAYTGDFTADRVAAIRAVSFDPPDRTPGSCLWDALYEAIERTQRLPLPRRVILLITDGADQTLPGGPACSQKTLDEVINIATQARARMPVYIMGIGGAQSLDADALQQLADATGGMLAMGETSGEITALFAKLTAGLRAELLVTAELAATGGKHQVQVEVTLADGKSYLAFGSVQVPAPVFIPPTQPSPVLPTVPSALATAGMTAEAVPLDTGTANPPQVQIADVGQDATTGDLLLRLDVSERATAVTAVIVLLDGEPLTTLPPDAFDKEIRLPLGELAEGTYTLAVEAYDTSGQVGRADLRVRLRSPAQVVAQAAVTETPTVGFTLNAPATPAPTATPPAGETIHPTLTPRPERATPTETEAASPGRPGNGGTLTGPALALIGVIIIMGGAALGGLWWWRSRRTGPGGGTGAMKPVSGTTPLPKNHFSYDAYAEETSIAGSTAQADRAEVTDFHRPDDEERTALWLGDVTRAKLDVVRSPDMEARVNGPYTLETPRITLGRDASNDIPFTGDRFVSSKHARILYIDDQWFVEELGALNKTYVNGREITGKTPLFDGDLLELGPYTRLRFTVEGAASAPGEGDEDVTRLSGR